MVVLLYICYTGIFRETLQVGLSFLCSPIASNLFAEYHVHD